jgi:hypothetical protein
MSEQREIDRIARVERIASPNLTFAVRSRQSFVSVSTDETYARLVDWAR